MAVLVVAHVTVALVMVLLLTTFGRLVAEAVPPPARLGAFAALAAVAAVVDLVAVARGGMTIGLRRQTPKSVAHDGERPWWVTPLIWGGDTGMVWTTFRVSSASWLLLAGALIGLAPWWAGAVYGLAFAGPLALLVRTGDGAPVCQVDPRRGRAVTRTVQVVGVVALVGPVALAAI